MVHHCQLFSNTMVAMFAPFYSMNGSSLPVVSQNNGCNGITQLGFSGLAMYYREHAGWSYGIVLGLSFLDG